MTSPVALLRSWIGILGYQALGFGVMIVTTLIVGLVVPPKVWGSYWLLLSVVQIVSGVGLSWISQSVLLFAKAELRRSNELRVTLWSALAMQAVLLLILVAGGWMARPLIASFIEIGPGLFVLLAFCVGLMSTFETVAYVLQADNRFQGLGLGAALSKLGPLLAALAVWAGARPTPELLLAGLGGGLALGLVATAMAMPRRTAAATGPTLASAREIVRYGVSLPVATAAGVASAWMHVWFVGAYGEAADVGVYGWAASIFALVNATLMPLSAVIAPHLADLALAGKQAQSQFRAGVFLAVVALVAAMLPAALGVLKVATLALPARYASSGPILIIFFAAVPAMVATFFASPLLKAYPDRITRLTFANVVMALTNVGLNLLLTTRLGGVGAAAALAVSLWTGALVVDRQAQLAVGLDRSSRNAATAFLLVAAAISVSSALLTNWLSPGPACLAGVGMSALALLAAYFSGTLRNLGPVVDQMTFLPHRVQRALTRFLV